MIVKPADLTSKHVLDLLNFHVAALRATSPPESCHVMDTDELQSSDVALYAAWDDDALLGIGGLKQHDAVLGEIKSMRTARAHERQGVGTALLLALIDHARALGLQVVKLETGSDDYFASARRLYERNGFTECGPFADYVVDLNSTYFELALT